VGFGVERGDWVGGQGLWAGVREGGGGGGVGDGERRLVYLARIVLGVEDW
jgi:hypothetical protein